MTKTQNYNLNKPEPNDPLRLADFNENADKIDAALAGKAEQSAVTAVESALGSKADASTLTALSQSVSSLSTTVNGKGNCKIATGSYGGAGTYGKNNPTALSFDFCPALVIVQVNLDYVVMVRGIAQCQHSNTSVSTAQMAVSWSDNSVSWYNTTDPAYQMNTTGKTYCYVAIGT